MHLSDDGVAFVARWEGHRNRAYNDALGHCTVGIGHLLHAGRCTDAELARVWTDDEVDDLFRDDVARYVEAVNDAVTVPLSQRQFDALVSFAFNWGIGEQAGFPATSVLALVNAGDLAAAAAELVDGKGPSQPPRWPDGRPYDKGLDGVRARRIAEAEWLRPESRPVKFVTRDEAGLRPSRATTAIGSALRGIACHWEGPHMGTPVHAHAAAGQRVAVDRIAAALLTLHLAQGEMHTGDQNVLMARDEAITTAEAEAAASVLAAADCYGLVAGIQAYHMDTMGWNDVAYNGIVCPHGYVFVGRGPGVRSGANGDANVNATHYALCYLGGEGDPFSDAGRSAFEDGYRWLLGTDDLSAYEWVGHRDLTSTACPGNEIHGFAHGPHPWSGSDPQPEPPEEDDAMAQALHIALDLAKQEQAREVGVPASKSSGAIKFGDIRGSFSVGVDPSRVEAERQLLARSGGEPFATAQERRRIGLVVVKHTHDGTGIGVPGQDADGIVWVPVGAGRHGEFWIEPGDESVQVALADHTENPDFAVVDLLFEIGAA